MILFAFLFSLLFLNVGSLRIPFDVRKQVSASTECATGDLSCGSLGNVNSFDSVYVSNITIGGQVFEVQLDTGSSDLWVNASKQAVPSAQVLPGPIVTSEIYGDGSNFTGNIATAEVQFHGFTVPNQALVLATEAINDNVSPLGVSGLIGLGLGGLSPILGALGSSSSDGKSFLANVFSQNSTIPDFIAFLLSRNQDLNTTAVQGAFTISEIEQGYEAINNQQALNLFPPGNTEYTVPIGGMTVAGKTVPLPATEVTTAGNTNPIGLLDTGSQALLTPASVIVNLWSQFSGAVATDSTQLNWMLPCDKEPPAVTFSLGGQAIPLHPLDVNPIGGTYKTSSGSLVSVCFGGLLASPPQANRFDFLLGTPLLKNAYTMFNFPSAQSSGGSVKLLAITDPTKASADFASTRQAQLALAPPATADQFTQIMNGDPSFVAVDAPSIDVSVAPSSSPAPVAAPSNPTAVAPAPSPTAAKSGANRLSFSGSCVLAIAAVLANALL